MVDFGGVLGSGYICGLVLGTGSTNEFGCEKKSSVQKLLATYTL